MCFFEMLFDVFSSFRFIPVDFRPVDRCPKPAIWSSSTAPRQPKISKKLWNSWMNLTLDISSTWIWKAPENHPNQSPNSHVWSLFSQFFPHFSPSFSSFPQVSPGFPRFPVEFAARQPCQVLHDALPLTALDPTEQVFAVLARETKVELLLQAAGGVEKGWWSRWYHYYH